GFHLADAREGLEEGRDAQTADDLVGLCFLEHLGDLLAATTGTVLQAGLDGGARATSLGRLLQGLGALLRGEGRESHCTYLLFCCAAVGARQDPRCGTSVTPIRWSSAPFPHLLPGPAPSGHVPAGAPMGRRHRLRPGPGARRHPPSAVRGAGAACRSRCGSGPAASRPRESETSVLPALSPKTSVSCAGPAPCAPKPGARIGALVVASARPRRVKASPTVAPTTSPTLPQRFSV